MNIEIFFAPDCSRCHVARRRLQAVVEEFSTNNATGIRWRAVDVIREIDHAVSLGVLSTPSIAIDGQLVFTGMPSEKRLRQAIERHLASTSSEPRT